MSPGRALALRTGLAGKRAQPVGAHAVAIAERADHDGAAVLETGGYRGKTGSMVRLV